MPIDRAVLLLGLGACLILAAPAVAAADAAPARCSERYSLVWSYDPTEADLGKRRGQIVDSWGEFTFRAHDGITIDRAPDGTPAIEVRYREGSLNGPNFSVNQLGDPGPEAACLRYRLFLADDFDLARRGGKFPGLYGGARPLGGCVDVTGEDGFSMRFAWRASKKFKSYGYYANKGVNCGQDIESEVPVAFGRWITLELELILNDPGEANGVARYWIDGRLGGEDRGIAYRTVDGVGVSGLWFHTAHGGRGEEAKPARDVYGWFKDIRLYAAR